MGGVLGDIIRGVTGRDDDDKDLTNLGLSMIPGLGSYIGSKEANQANAAQSQQQMDFQERMSSTAHQREVQDLEKAGLNPLLSAGGTGASSPGGAQAVMQNMYDKVSSGVQDAIAFKKGLEKSEAEIKLLESQKKNTDTDTRTMKSDASKSEFFESLWNKVGTQFKKLTNNPLWKKAEETQEKYDNWLYKKQPDIKVGGKK